MDIERYIVDAATLYLLWQGNRIFAQQGPPVQPINWQGRLRSATRYWPLVVMAILAVAIWVRPYFAPSRNGFQAKTQQRSGDILPPFFSFEGITRYAPEATVAEGKKLAFNTHFINPAPRTPAYNAVGEQGLFLEPPDRSGEELAGKAFDSQVRAKREDYLANKIPDGAVVGNAPQWATVPTSEDLTSTQVSDILSGHLTVYILLWQAWTDSPNISDQKHESCYCEFLQPPIPAQITDSDMALWHACSCPAGFSR